MAFGSLAMLGMGVGGIYCLATMSVGMLFVEGYVGLSLLGGEI